MTDSTGSADVPDVSDNPGKHRYEIREAGQLAGFTGYRFAGDRVEFTHTEIGSAFEGRGLGGRLIKAALDDVRRQHKTVIPLCPFVAGYISGHPGYADLVDPSYRPEGRPTAQR